MVAIKEMKIVPPINKAGISRKVKYEKAFANFHSGIIELPKESGKRKVIYRKVITVPNKYSQYPKRYLFLKSKIIPIARKPIKM